MQAQTVQRRLDTAAELWVRLESLTAERKLPERTLEALFDAASGFRVTGSRYRNFTGVEARTAARDLRTLVDSGLLIAYGETRGRYYVGSDELRAVQHEIRNTSRLTDPYPALIAEIEAVRASGAG